MDCTGAACADPVIDSVLPPSRFMDMVHAMPLPLHTALGFSVGLVRKRGDALALGVEQTNYMY